MSSPSAVLNQGQLGPSGHTWKCLETVLAITRDAAQHPVTENDLDLNVKSAEAEKPFSAFQITALFVRRLVLNNLHNFVTLHTPVRLGTPGLLILL